MQTATERSKAAVNAIASGAPVFDVEKSRHFWLAAACLVEQAKAAEHAAFMGMRELETGHAQSGQEMIDAAKNHFTEIKSQLIFLGGLLK